MSNWPSKRRDFLLATLQSNIDECILWPFSVRKSSGYGAYSEGRKNFDAHNFVCRKAHGEPRKGQETAHSCGKKLCVNPKHVRWSTPLQNMEDAKQHQTLRGGGSYRQRLFADERAAIRTSKDSLVTLAGRYGMEPAYIGRIRRAVPQYDL